MSDVAAGAIIGIVVARSIVNRHSRPCDGKWSMIPIHTGELTGLAWTVRF